VVLVLFLRSYRLCTQHCPAILPGKCSYRGKLALVGQSGNLDLLPIDDGRIIFVTMWTNDDGEAGQLLPPVGLLAQVQIWTSLEKHTTTIMNQKKAIYIHLYTGRTTFLEHQKGSRRLCLEETSVSCVQGVFYSVSLSGRWWSFVLCFSSDM
jgi:hypothetical protein